MEGKVPPCFKCGKAIAQVPYKYDGMTFHARCLQCSTCDKKLAGKPFIVASRGIFCGEQCKLSFTEQHRPSVSKHPSSEGRDGATSPELITDFEALQSISQEVQKRSNSPLSHPERVTDYPTSHSLANLRLSPSPIAHKRPTSLSPVPDSHYSSTSTLNRSDSLSAVSETSGTSDTSKPAQKRILKKSNGPRRASTNHVRWNLDGVERATDDGDSTSMDSTEASWSGDPYRQAKEKFQRSRSAWKDFEAPPLAGSTGLTPAPPRVQQKTMFHPDGIPLSPIHRETSVKFPGYYELDPQAPLDMGTSHSTPLRNTGVQELYEDEEMGSSDNTRASETVAAGFSVLKIHDSSLASLEVTRADERLGTCMFEFPKETPRLSAPLAPKSTPSVATPTIPPPLPMTTLSPVTGMIRDTVGTVPTAKRPSLVGQGIGAAKPGVMGAGATGVVGSNDTNVDITATGRAQILGVPQALLDDDDASDYDHLEEKTVTRPPKATSGISNPPRKTTSGSSNGSSGTDGAFLSKVPSGLTDPSNSPSTSSLPNPDTTSSPPNAQATIPPPLITANSPSLLATSVPKREQASVQSSCPEQSNGNVEYSQHDIEQAIEVLEHEMSALQGMTTPLATPTPPTVITVPSTVVQGFHSAGEITKVWRSTFPEPQSTHSTGETHQTSDQPPPTHHPQAEQPPSPPPPPLPTKNRRISRSDRDDEGNLLPSVAGKKEAVQLNQWPDPVMTEHSKNLPPVIEILSLTPPEGDEGELILPPPSEFLDIPPQSKEDDRDDYFDLLEPNGSKASKALQQPTSNPLKMVPGRPVDLASSNTQEECSIMWDGLPGGGPLQQGAPLYREDPLIDAPYTYKEDHLISAHHNPHPVQRVHSSRVASTSSKPNELDSNSGQTHGIGAGKLTATRALHMSDSESSLNDALRAAKGRYGGAPIVAQHNKPPLFQVNNSRADQRRLPNQVERPAQGPAQGPVPGERQLRRTSSQAPVHSSSQPLVHSSTQAPFHSSSQSLIHSSIQAPVHSSSQPLIHSSTQAPFHSSSQSLIHSSSQPLFHSSTQPPVPLLNNKFNPMRHQAQSSTSSGDGMTTYMDRRDGKKSLQETGAQPVCAACGKPITTLSINHDKRPYHSTCYHCVQCGCSLVDKAFSRTRNGLYCKEHLPAPSISSTTPSQTRRTDHQTGYPGHTHYHQSLTGSSVTSV